MTLHVPPPVSAGLVLPSPYLLFLGDVQEAGFAKTAFGLRDWAADRCLGECALPEARVTAGLPRLGPREAAAKGAKALVIGVASQGGAIMAAWVPMLVEALEAGLDLVSGMHTPLSSVEPLRAAAARCGRSLIDVRTPPRDIPVATGRRRTGRRLLTVGTDCALGKKYTALALARAFRARGVDVDFRATGQTGIMIAGRGIPMDAVVADFEAGAAELLSPDAAPAHWDVIEGQGAVTHPAYGAVSLGLLYGSQPDVFVLCHEPGRTHLLGLEGHALPTLEESIALHVMLGRRVNPSVRCGGISLNTSQLDDDEREHVLADTADRLSLPAADPLRGGPAFEALTDACLAPSLG